MTKIKSHPLPIVDDLASQTPRGRLDVRSGAGDVEAGSRTAAEITALRQRPLPPSPLGPRPRLAELDLASQMPPRRADERSSAGDLEVGRRTTAEIGKLTQQPLHSESVAEGLMHRKKPVLANMRDLTKETRVLVQGATSAAPANLISTTYGPPHETNTSATGVANTSATGVAKNLLLDINMVFEEELQKQLEAEPHFVGAIKDAVKLIHANVSIGSMEDLLSDDQVLTADVRAKRETYIESRLEQVYPEGALKKFLETNQWDDASVKAFMSKKLDSSQLTKDEISEADGLLKLLKMLKTQLPYFGGSVEYKQHITNSLEFWVYHMSTLTKDPDRQYWPSVSGAGQLNKPLMDYRTNKDGAVPFMNQRNLGTGVVESKWHELPPDLRNLIETRLKNFGEHVSAHGDNRNPASATKLWRAYDAIGSNLEVDSVKVTAEQLWDSSSEDTRKAIYADMCRIPWSDAHLHGGNTFEQTFSVAEAPEDIRSRHPTVSGPGLSNVAGVFGNILEDPLTAGSKYMNEGGQNLEQLKANGELNNLPGVPDSRTTLMRDFSEKQTKWYDEAYRNQKPIIGGMSGHTLGYLNLYAEALKECSEKDRAKAPSIETLRAVMLAGLTGNKRHHSYDEVMAASTSIVNAGDETPAYESPASYADVMNSNDPKVRECAARAKEKTAERYLSLNLSNAVVNELIGDWHTPDSLAEFKANIGDYIDNLGSEDTAKLQKAAASVIEGATDSLQLRKDKQAITGVLSRPAARMG